MHTFYTPLFWAVCGGIQKYLCLSEAPVTVVVLHPHNAFPCGMLAAIIIWN